MRPCGVCQTSRANYLCMEVELEKAVTSNAMSNLQSEKRSLAHTKLDCIHKTGGYLQFCSFTFLHCTIYSWDPGSLVKFQSRNCAIALFVSHRGPMSNTQFGELVATTWTVASVWLAGVPSLPRQAKQLHGGCRWTWERCHCTWNVKSRQHNTKQTCRIFGKRVATYEYNFAAALFCTAQSVVRTLDHGSLYCPKMSLWCSSCTAAFAGKICSRMGPTNSTAWKNNLVTFPLLFQPWCDWQH